MVTLSIENLFNRSTALAETYGTPQPPEVAADGTTSETYLVSVPVSSGRRVVTLRKTVTTDVGGDQATEVAASILHLKSSSTLDAEIILKKSLSTGEIEPVDSKVVNNFYRRVVQISDVLEPKTPPTTPTRRRRR